MAIGVQFRKAKAEHFLDCLAHGKPIQPQDARGWTHHDILALAGACFFAAMSHGPALYRDVDRSKLPKERREAIEETLDEDLHAAIGWLALATQWVQDGEYDECFEPEHEAVVISGREGTQQVVPAKGFKQTA